MNPNQDTPNPEMPAVEPPIISDHQNEIFVQNIQPIVVEPVVQQSIEIAQPMFEVPIETQSQAATGTAETHDDTTGPVLYQKPENVIIAPPPSTLQAIYERPVIGEIQAKPRKSLVRLFIKIAVLIVILIGLGFGAWHFILKDLMLKDYSYDSYSISLPTSYIVNDESTSDNIRTFIKKNGDGSDDKANTSVMVAVSNLMDSKTRQDYESFFDEYCVEDKKTDVINYFGFNAMSGSPFSSSGVTMSKYKKDGISVCKVSGSYSVSITSGHFGGAFFVSDDKVAQVYIINGRSEDNISAEAIRIIDTFKFK